MRQGVVRVAGHLGELMQGRLGPSGPVALVSLPCPVLAVEAWHLPGSGLSIHGSGQRLLTPTRALDLLDRLDLKLSGRVVLSASMPAGGGAGASTASLVALALLAGANVPPPDLARACVMAEGASDPLMFGMPERLLWASRRAEVLSRLPPIPRFDVVGGFFGEHRRTDPRDMDFPDISDLISPWRAAARARDATALARIASTSAERTLALRGPVGDPTARLASSLGALGFAIAHTGSARAFLFRPGTVPDNVAPRLRRMGFSGIVQFAAGGQK
ncbi:propanediol utilization protein [Defluviimonas sp. WL0050]|uniref:Propanediol utilization protein n=1 Tax=Albidovulum litorale TaxID=2984134 RepID=A0ABT2ZNQ4_9RHOB|nr:propanediol utilization protein [Defluviimonas sp. WL0050]MCV2872765.1 propanediol utilization protein [Defluviimonas sp. WL0050]